MKENIFFNTQKMNWEVMGGGISRQIMGYDDKIMLVKVKFEKDAVGKPHQHFHSQVSYVVYGSFELTIGEQKQMLQEGDSFYIPPNVVHGALCVETGILIDVFSPVREDFLDGSGVSYFGNK
jgi:quercetin dioxygenase-like cupin family protein